MCCDTEQLLRFLASHDVVLGEFRCERCGLNLVSVVLSVCGFSAVCFSPLPEISEISIVMYVSELFVDGKCIINSPIRRTFARGRHSLFYAILTCRIFPQPQIRGFQYGFFGLFTLNEICLVRRSFARGHH